MIKFNLNRLVIESFDNYMNSFKQLEGISRFYFIDDRFRLHVDMGYDELERWNISDVAINYKKLQLVEYNEILGYCTYIDETHVTVNKLILIVMRLIKHLYLHDICDYKYDLVIYEKLIYCIIPFINSDYSKEMLNMIYDSVMDIYLEVINIYYRCEIDIPNRYYRRYTIC